MFPRDGEDSDGQDFGGYLGLTRALGTRLAPSLSAHCSATGDGQGCIRRGLKGGGGVGWDPPPPMGPAEGGPKKFKLKSSWHRRHRSKNLAVSLQLWKRGGSGGGVPPLLLRCTAVLIHHWGRGGRGGPTRYRCVHLLLALSSETRGVTTRPTQDDRLDTVTTTSHVMGRRVSAGLVVQWAGRRH